MSGAALEGGQENNQMDRAALEDGQDTLEDGQEDDQTGRDALEDDQTGWAEML